MLGVYSKKEITSIYEKIDSVHRYHLLTGGIGVGKTLYAKILANLISKKKSADEFSPDIDGNPQVELLSFGAHYSRENFIYGINVTAKNGKLSFKEEKKRFIEICEEAERNKNKEYAVIFDDINRADISGTLGDLLSAMESKDIGNEIHAGDESMTIPDNLYIIATANPLVGREKLDYAWMRRFWHHNISPDERYFGFDFDGSKIGDEYEEYREIIDEAWENAYEWKEDEWRKNRDISYDDASSGTINKTGLAFLRQYQWEVFMHIKIMYERYFFNPYDYVRRDQYLPGHGMFLTYDPELSYGKNLVLFLKQVKHSILPLIKKMYSDGILSEEARLDIWAFSDLCGEKQVIDINNDKITQRIQRIRERKKRNYDEEKLAIYVNDIVGNEKNNKDGWSNLYFNICTNIWLRRVDRKQTPDTTKQDIFAYTKCSYLMERQEYKDDVWSVYANSDKLPCHQSDIVLMIEKIGLYWPQQVVKNRVYLVKKKNKEWLLFDGILKQLKKYQRIEDERVKNMSNVKEYSKIEIMDKLKIKQMILQGPPGTSKTYGAKYKIIAQALPNPANVKKEYLLRNYQIHNYDTWDQPYGWDMVQFHPSYGYEDFVRGITVKTNDNQDVIYETVNKILGKMCELAQQYEKDKESKFFLIIDEINRADIATVFGELIYALECRDEEISIPYEVNGSYKLKIPNNLYIIGTMNTADKSIGTIDYAIRRRFLFFDCQPDIEVIKTYFENKSDLERKAESMLNNLKAFIDTTINKNYHAKDLYIGHTYFLVKDENELKLRLEFQIIPILREYYENGILTEWGKIESNDWMKDLAKLLGVKNKTEEDKDEKDKIDNLFEKICRDKKEEDK